MKSKDFSIWIARIPHLSRRQRAVCLKELGECSDRTPPEEIPSAIADAVAESCPHCDCHHLHHHGQASGLQRWKCQGCGKTFNILTGTPLARLRMKGKWIDNAKAMLNGHCLRRTATDVKIHRNTAFRWRHRFLKYPQQAQNKDLSGIAECDATRFYYSEKGSRNLDRSPRKRGGDKVGPGKSRNMVHAISVRDRSGLGADRVARGSQTESACDLFINHLRPDTLLITDGCKDLCSAARKRDANSHLALPALEGRGLKGSPFNIQTINAFHSNLKTWIARFNGVATKYLANYLGWHRHKVEQTHNNDPETFIALSFRPLSVSPQLTVT